MDKQSILSSAAQTKISPAKHQQWLQNRSYVHHLDCLKRIKGSKSRDMTFSTAYQYQHRSKNSSPNKKKPKRQIFKNNQCPNHRLSVLQQIYSPAYPISSKYNRKCSEGKNNYLHEGSVNQNKQQSLKNSHFGLNMAQRTSMESKKENVLLPQLSVDRTVQKQNQTFTCGDHQNLLYHQNIKNPQGLQLHTERKNAESRNRFNGGVLQQSQNLTGRSLPNNITLKEKQLLMNNFLLGKRIVEVSSVISKKKHDSQFRKHKQLLKSMAHLKTPFESQQFRLRKLQQHKQVIDKMSVQCMVASQIQRKMVLMLSIQSIQIFKYKFNSFKNIILVMKSGSSKENISKGKSQVSQCVPTEQLANHNFYFSLKRKIINQNKPIIIQIKNVKNLDVLSAGTFSFKFDKQADLKQQNVQLFNFSKLIGTIKFSAHLKKKEELTSHQTHES